MKKIFLSFVGFLVLGGCAVKPTKTDLSSNKIDPNMAVFVEPEAKPLFQQGEKEFQKKRYSEALVKFQAVRSKWPKSKAAELAHYRIASSWYYKGDYIKASQEFESFLKKHPISVFAFDASYNWAASLYQLGSYERVKQILGRVRQEEIRKQGAKRSITFYQLEAINLEALSDFRGASIAYSHQLAYVSDENGKKAIQNKINGLVNQISSPAQLEEVLDQAADSFTKALVAKRLSGSSQIKQDKEASDRDELAVFRKQQEFLPPMELGAGTRGTQNNIGVILPLKGKLAPYGKKALEGILLASRMFQSPSEDSFNVFVEDSGSSPTMAQAALETLVNEKNIMGVIGPLNFKEATAVAEKAQALGVVNISLASKGGVSSFGPYVFQNALTPKVQLENLVRFVVSDKGFKRFAILSPNNAFGRDMAFEFWDQVEAQGGKIVGIEFYSPNETDFQDPIRSLVGLKDPRFRRLEWTALQNFLKETKTKTGRDSKAKLKPIVDFDAVFLPDSPPTVASIAGSLAYLDVNGIALLGTTEWNSDQLYKRGGRFVENAFFPGVMNPVTRSPGQREFIRSYQEAFGTPPDLLAAQAYEAMEILSVAIKKAQSSNRADLAQQIFSLQNLEMPIGLASFDENRVAKRNLPLYTLDRFGNFIEQ